jgi:hypothetical protein
MGPQPQTEEALMKTPLIAASVVAYTLLALAVISHAGLSAPSQLF